MAKLLITTSICECVSLYVCVCYVYYNTNGSTLMNLSQFVTIVRLLCRFITSDIVVDARRVPKWPTGALTPNAGWVRVRSYIMV